MDRRPCTAASRPCPLPAARRHRAARRLLAGLLLAATASAAAPTREAAADALPERLQDTGLFGAGVQAFTPQHTLWTDGAAKRRWIRLPPGTAIDARDPDAWRFPPGTRLWKEFAHGRRVETRYMVLGSDRRWRFASYVWSDDGRSATRAPAQGLLLGVDDAPQGRYAIPSQADCLACHDGARSPVLGFSALQLGPQLKDWMARGQLRHAPAAWRDAPPQPPGASDAERAARGYLHANCGHCHHDRGGVPVPLVLAQDSSGATPAPSRRQLAEALQRMATRQPLQQMPPLGTRIPDPQGLALLRAWLDDTSRSNPQSEENPP